MAAPGRGAGIAQDARDLNNWMMLVAVALVIA
jgi:hypothetical protein